MTPVLAYVAGVCLLTGVGCWGYWLGRRFGVPLAPPTEAEYYAADRRQKGDPR